MLTEQYQKSTAVSQSMIKDFDKLSLHQFYKKWILQERDSNDSKYLVFGSLVDQLASNPKELDKEFVVANCKIPSDTIAKIVTMVYEQNSELPLESLSVIILEMATLVNYGQGWKADTVVNKIVTLGNDYFEFLKKTDGRKIISQEDYNDAWGCVQMLKSSPSTSLYFNKDQFGIELIFQQEIIVNHAFSELESIDLKGCIDVLRINHIAHEIEIVDLKYTQSIKEFPESIRKYGYALQLSFYYFLVKEWLKTYDNGSMKDYKIKAPMNVAIERYAKVPHIFEYELRDIFALKSGDYVRKLKGWHDTLYEIFWHMHNHEWNYIREMKVNGKIKVTI